MNHTHLRSACESVGLDPYVGYLHVERPGRPSLALDLCEEFRASVADRVVLSLVNLRQITAKDFDVYPTGEVSLTDAGRKTFLGAWQKRKLVEARHPLLEETMPTGVAYLMQARLLARHLRGELDFYPEYVWR